MTTATVPDDPITSPRDLVEYFRSGAKPRTAWRVGLEQEKIGVRQDGRPVPYDGPDGIKELIAQVARRGYTPTLEDGHPIALQRGAESITLEPGGQVELSGPALPTAAAGCDVLRQHIRELTEIARPLGIRFIAAGFRPFGCLEEVPWLPKRRYVVMRDYLPRHGTLGIEMMKRTATVQANFDYSDEQDAIEKMRTAFGITSILTGLFAASPIVDGRPSGYKTYRAAIWLDTDEARCGIPQFVFEPGFGFDRYAEWALDVPMFFVVRDGAYHQVSNLPFRRFVAEGWNGERATLTDWQTHLSTLFPEVRLKRYIEVRGADAGPLPFAEGLGALWRGLLDDPDARSAAWALVSDWSFEERMALRRDVPRLGLAGSVAGRPMAELAAELCAIAAEGLRRLPDAELELPLLDPLMAAAESARSPADVMLEEFAAAGGDPAKLVEAWELEA